MYKKDVLYKKYDLYIHSGLFLTMYIGWNPALRGAFELVVSPEILAETKEKLVSKFGFSHAEVASVEESIHAVAAMVEPEVSLSVLEDEPDNRVLECAAHSRALAIVTGVRHLLELKSFEGIGIMTMAELLYTFPEPPYPK